MWYYRNTIDKILFQETKTKTFAGYGQNLRVFGRPEESGYYFCSAEMDGTLHNSRIATLDISGMNNELVG